jgi:hypothetical protein
MTSGSCRKPCFDRAGALGELVFDRFLDCDDAAIAFSIEHVDDHGQRGGLAGAGDAGEQDQAVAEVGESLGQPFREAGPLERRDL